MMMEMESAKFMSIPSKGSGLGYGIFYGLSEE
jgi:hypothetical protein